MNKTILEQALDHLLNKEDAKASALLHDYYVGIGRKVYEDIMTDDTEFGDEFDTQRDMDAVDEDLTEVEGDDEHEMPDGTMMPDDEMDVDAEAEADLGADMGMDDGAGDEPAGEASDVADAMLDVESALAQLKAEFEEMVSGEDGNDEFAADDLGGDEFAADDEFAAPKGELPMEGLEESLDLQAVPKQSNEEGRAAGAGTGYANGVTGETNKRSPVAGKNPMMARPATNFAGGAAQGTPSGTSPSAAPKSQDQGYTTKPAMSKVAAPGVAPGRANESKVPTRRVQK